jgi:hypothetical protein
MTGWKHINDNSTTTECHEVERYRGSTQKWRSSLLVPTEQVCYLRGYKTTHRKRIASQHAEISKPELQQEARIVKRIA